MTKTKTDPETAKKDALRILKLAARGRKRAMAKVEEAEAALNAAIVEADRAEIPRLTIFQESGYGARQTIYNVLGKA